MTESEIALTGAGTDTDASEQGVAVGLVGERLQLVWNVPKAPGQPVALQGQLAGKPLSLMGKTVGSRRRNDGRYDVQVRLINLRREQRLALQSCFEGGV